MPLNCQDFIKKNEPTLIDCNLSSTKEREPWFDRRRPILAPMAAPPQPPASLDYWRGFFSGARASIFDAIDAAIRVAAADHPDALRARRDAIAERLYTALIALPAPEAPGHPTRGQPPLLLPEGAGSVPSLCSSDRAEVVNNGGGAAPRNKSDDDVVAEAFRVKAALSNAQEKVPPLLPSLLILFLIC
jgi:hypothetical protein